MINRKITRAKTALGEVLLEEFLYPMGLTKEEFAAKIDMSLLDLEQIIFGAKYINREIAQKFSKVLNTSEEFWINLQTFQDE